MDFFVIFNSALQDFFSASQFSNINYDNQSYNLIAIYVWIFPAEIKNSVRCDMAFIEPMHHNKSNITYLKRITVTS